MLALRWARIAFSLLMVVGVSASAWAQENGCVTCHFQNAAAAEERQQATDRGHLDDWERSTHARANVGCDSCHRGDPNVMTLTGAHEGVLSSANPASPVYASNIPSTCGGCHEGQLDAFQTSRHYQLLSSGDRRAPSCMTCHEALAVRLPSTRGINSKCALCHGPDGVAPISEHQELVRLMRERIQDHRYSLALVRTVIDHTANQERRADLERRHDEAVVPLTEAVEAWHAFAFDRAAAPLARAGASIEELVQDLTPP